jgi:hypothetical protein
VDPPEQWGGAERRKDLATENPPKVKITHVNAHEGDNVHIIGAIKGHQAVDEEDDMVPNSVSSFFLSFFSFCAESTLRITLRLKRA